MVFAFALDLFDVLVKLCDVFQRQGSDGKEDATILAVGLGGKGYGMLPEFRVLSRTQSHSAPLENQKKSFLDQASRLSRVQGRAKNLCF